MADILGAAARTPARIAGNVLAAVVIERAGAHGEGRALIVERAHGADIDGGGDAARDDVGSLRLVDGYARDDFGRVDFPADVAVGLGRGDFAAVDEAEHEAWAKAANGGLAGVTAVARGGDARQTGKRIRDGDVGQDADVLRTDLLGDDGLRALGVERVTQRGAQAGDDDGVVFGRALVGCGGVGRLCKCRLRKRLHAKCDGERAGRTENGAKLQVHVSLPISRCLIYRTNIFVGHESQRAAIGSAGKRGKWRIAEGIGKGAVLR